MKIFNQISCIFRRVIYTILKDIFEYLVFKFYRYNYTFERGMSVDLKYFVVPAQSIPLWYN